MMDKQITKVVNALQSIAESLKRIEKKLNIGNINHMIDKHLEEKAQERQAYFRELSENVRKINDDHFSSDHISQ